MREKQRSVFVGVLERAVESRAMFRDIKHLTSWLYDQIYAGNVRADSSATRLQNLIQRHLELKMKVTDDARREAVLGIIKGAD